MAKDIASLVEAYLEMQASGRRAPTATARLGKILEQGAEIRGGYRRRGDAEGRHLRLLDVGRALVAAFWQPEARQTYLRYVRGGRDIGEVMRARRVAKSAAYRWVGQAEEKIARQLHAARRRDAYREVS
jgi:hypothetical protein